MLLVAWCGVLPVDAARLSRTRLLPIVSVGDVQAARRLRLPFVAVCIHGDSSALRQGGVSHVIDDFTDGDVLRRALLEARVPAGAAPVPGRNLL